MRLLGYNTPCLVSSCYLRIFLWGQATGWSPRWEVLPKKCKRSFLDLFLAIEVLEGETWIEKNTESFDFAFPARCPKAHWGLSFLPQALQSCLLPARAFLHLASFPSQLLPLPPFLSRISIKTCLCSSENSISSMNNGFLIFVTLLRRGWRVEEKGRGAHGNPHGSFHCGLNTEAIELITFCVSEPTSRASRRHWATSGPDNNCK